MKSSFVNPAALGVVLAFAACSPATPPVAGPHLAPAHLHTYRSAATGIRANAYLLETARGVIVVDATLTVSDARALRAQVDALGKPLAAIFITHGHPDHYNGLTELVAGTTGVPIYATAAVDQHIRTWDGPKERQWKGMFGDEWPATRTFPDHVVADGETVTVDGVAFTPHDTGVGESFHDAFWIARDAATAYVFIGDLVFNGEHSYVSDGHTLDWLASLARVRPMVRGMRLYPGHGPAGGDELFDAEIAYLEKIRAEVKALAGGRPQLTDAEEDELVKRMTAYLPGGQLTFLVKVGGDAVAAELAVE